MKCCNVQELDYNYVFTDYEPNLINLRNLAWRGRFILDYNDFVMQAHYFSDYLKLKNTLKANQYIAWLIPLDQAWMNVHMYGYPTNLFWIEANLEVRMKPEPMWSPAFAQPESIWLNQFWVDPAEVQAFADEWVPYLAAHPKWY